MSADAAKLKINRSEPTIFVTGVSGQDGSLMVDYLLKTTTYNIVGGARRLAVHNHININHLKENSRFTLVNFDLTDTHSIDKLVLEIRPIILSILPLRLLLNRRGIFLSRLGSVIPRECFIFSKLFDNIVQAVGFTTLEVQKSLETSNTAHKTKTIQCVLVLLMVPAKLGLANW